jgi:hypothetical protein
MVDNVDFAAIKQVRISSTVERKLLGDFETTVTFNSAFSSSNIILSIMKESGSSTFSVFTKIWTSSGSPFHESIALNSSDTNTDDTKPALSVTYELDNLFRLNVNSVTTKLLGDLS